MDHADLARHFFVSSRRRHTRFDCDWSSDVCSSDLALRASDAGKKAVLMGWVNRCRDLGNLIFIDMRDRTGVTQVVCNKELNPAIHKKAGLLRNEYVVAAGGKVKMRGPQTINKNNTTGEVV